MYRQSGYLKLQEELRAKQNSSKDYLKAANWLSYQLNPRAIIFRRDATGIQGVMGMQRTMRYNRYKDDPVRDHET